MADSGLSYWLKKQLSAFEEKFSEADKDNNGTLSLQEITDVLKNAGFSGTDEDMKAIFKFADTNKDSKVSRNEYMTACKKVPKISLKEMLLRRAFKKIDKDGSGFVTTDEILEVIGSEEAGLKLPAEKSAQLLSGLIHDSDKKLSYEEFLYHFNYDQQAAQLQDLFNKLDTDKSGALSRQEIVDGIKADDELAFNAGNLSALLISHCQDENVKIKYKEFVSVVASQSKK